MTLVTVRSGYMNKTSILLGAFLLALSACSGSQETPTITPTPTPQGNDVEPSDGSSQSEEAPFFVQAEAEAESEDAAYAAAVDRLEAALYGEDPWTAALGLPSHDPTRDPMRRAEADTGRVRVTVGIERERVVELLSNIAELPLETTVPEPLSQRIDQLYQEHLMRFVCSRRQALLQETCDPPPPADRMTAQIRELALTVRIQSVYQDGVPLDSAGRPLRALAARAEIATSIGEWVPLPGLPAAAVLPEGVTALASTTALSDEDGMIRFTFVEGATWPEGLRLVLDRERLLGPLEEMWPSEELPMTGRRTSSRRWSLVATVRVQGRNASQKHIASNLQKALGQRGLKARVTLPSDVSKRLRTATPAQLAKTLPGLADSWAGRIDVLVRVDLDSEYASPMGDHRVWYEAQGRIEAFDVWTGRQLASVETTATASGVGEERADRAAQTSFAKQAAERLVAKLPMGP